MFHHQGLADQLVDLNRATCMEVRIALTRGRTVQTVPRLLAPLLVQNFHLAIVAVLLLNQKNVT